jgi:hypothetical protein
MNMDLATEIIGAVKGVTKTWAKQRKAEERHQAARMRRQEVLYRDRRITVKEVAYEIMAEAYRKASSGGTLPAMARQIMYAARPEIIRRTDRSSLDDQYFCQTLLPNYMAEHPSETANWDVVFDARGHFEEPHTKVIVPLGTIDVRNDLGSIGHINAETMNDLTVRIAGATYPTIGPRHRFSAILFIEKEGFLPLFKRVHLAERYDVAIMSTKGLSVTAARMLVERICAQYGIPLLVLHDFDKSGFSILGTLHRSTRRYAFTRGFEVVDLGLRLADVQKWDLEGEEVHYGKSDPRPNLESNGATEEEIEFLCSGGDEWNGYSGQRVELNAFASGDLVAWIESMLKKMGIKKVVPDKTTLTIAYRRAVAKKLLKERTAEIARAARAEAAQVSVPKDLAKIVGRQLKKHPKFSWDDVVAGLVKIGDSEKNSGGDSAS